MRLRVFYRLTWLMVNLIRIVCYMTVAGLKACRRVALQMWYKNKFQSYYESISRTKKCLIIGIVLLIILLYMWPSWLTLSKSRSHEYLMPHRWLLPTDRPIDESQICLEAKLEQYRRDVENYNVIINHSPLLRHEKYYIAFVGNGYVASTVSSSSRLYIRSNNRTATVSVPVNFYPVVEARIEGFPSSEAHVINILEGVVHRVQCFQAQNGVCIVISSTTYAHRRRPSTLVQEIRIHNPTDKSVTVDLRQIGLSDWSEAKSENRRFTTARLGDVDCSIISGSVPVDSLSTYAVVIAFVKLSEAVTVKPNKVWSSLLVTVVKYDIVPSAQVQDKIKELQRFVRQELNEVLNIEAGVLRQDHSSVWRALWSSGFGISLSLAEGAMNGDKINATMYYVLSHTPSPIFELGRSSLDKSELEKLLYFPDHCYDGHHTLQNVKMWRNFDKVEDVFESASMWLITLGKQGCATMLKAGADGVLQAMMLSYGALKFSNHHLEFGTHPRDLHRDYFFRRINYGNDTHVNISVQVGEDNKAVLYVSLDRNNRLYYACDAGCLDPPEKLSRDVLKFPVKLTDPVTPILYITADKEHMEDLKHAIHVNRIDEAPAHEHNLMVLHKHGHHFGGLPMLFWGTIGLLIFVFHLFLFKLIYNEYCSNTEQQTPPSRYHRHGGRYI